MLFKKGELFCGPGGLALGAKKAGIISNGIEEYSIEHAWANDICEFACQTFSYNICPDNPETVFHKPVQNLDIENLPEFNALTFGFPCNDFSIVGEQKGINGNYGPLYSYGVKILNRHEPDWFLAENVGGLQSANDGKIFVKILSEMAKAGKKGYRLTTHLYKFEEYGVPQCRHRILIVGINKKYDYEFRVPKPTHSTDNFITCREAIENPPIAQDAANHEYTAHSKKVIEMLGYIPPGKNAWIDEIPERLRLNVKGAKLSQIYRRLDPDLPAYTITGSGGGGTHVYHWKEPRALTNRERARLQTFDDNYIFFGGKEKVREQIGMAVPPAGAKVIFEAILKTFAGLEYEYIDPKWEFDEEKQDLRVI